MAKIDAFFNLMFEQRASDLHLSSGNPPMLRINGELQRVDYPPLESDALKAMLYEIAPDYKIKQFEETGDVDFGYEIPNISRFRVNFFNQKNGVAAVFRQIPSRVLSFEDFEKLDAPLPAVLKKFAMLHRGWSWSPAPPAPANPPRSRPWWITQQNRKDHIITVEDPIEFVHESKNCLVNHREVGVHTKSFASGLRGALREDPDIILVGEMRDLETIELAITAAATGHLVFGTLHTPARPRPWTASSTFSPPTSRTRSAQTLSEALKGVVAQTCSSASTKKAASPPWKSWFQHRHRQPRPRRQDPPDPRHDPGRQEIRQPAARRRHHGACPHEAHLARGSLRQGARQEEIPPLPRPPPG
jgi:twitching motility protein PilT